MKQSEVGGQAVIEGVMMKNKEKFAIAVRNSDNEIIIEKREYVSLSDKYKVLKIPILRGILAFVESMVVGMKTLTFSANIFEEEIVETETEEEKSNENQESIKENIVEENEKDEDDNDLQVYITKTEDIEEVTKKSLKSILESNKESIIMGITVIISIVLAVSLFMILPYLISEIFNKFIESRTLLIILEGLIRLSLFIGYVAAISQIKDIQRVFMYHGAEHKVINCIESGQEPTIQNVVKCSKLHRRCGTSFLLTVMIVSIIFFMFIRVDTMILRIIVRLLLVPIISGVAYEFIKLSGKTQSTLILKLATPGLFLQSLTTREPDEGMIEVAIKSLEAVFDWREYFAENGIELP